MKNNKGYTGMLVGVVIGIGLMLLMFFIWQKMIVKDLQKTTQKASEEAGVEINAQDASPQGQVSAVRDMVGKIQDKENGNIENELKK